MTKSEIAGVKREFDARITEQLPDERVAWASTGEVRQAGVVTFHRLDENKTRVTLQMEFEPHGLAEQAGDKLGVVEALLGVVEGKAGCEIDRADVLAVPALPGLYSDELRFIVPPLITHSEYR